MRKYIKSFIWKIEFELSDRFLFQIPDNTSRIISKVKPIGLSNMHIDTEVINNSFNQGVFCNDLFCGNNDTRNVHELINHMIDQIIRNSASDHTSDDTIYSPINDIFDVMIREFITDINSIVFISDMTSAKEYELSRDISNKLSNLLNLIYIFNKVTESGRLYRRDAIGHDLNDPYNADNNLEVPNKPCTNNAICVCQYMYIDVKEFALSVIEALYKVDMIYIIDVILANAILYNDETLLELLCRDDIFPIIEYQNIMKRYRHDYLIMNHRINWHAKLSPRDLVMYRAFELLETNYYDFTRESCALTEYVRTSDGIQRIEHPSIRITYPEPNLDMTKTIIRHRLDFLAKVYHPRQLDQMIDQMVTELQESYVYPILDDAMFGNDIPYAKHCTVGECVYDSLTSLGKSVIADSVMAVKGFGRLNQSNNGSCSNDLAKIALRYKSARILSYLITCKQRSNQTLNH